MDLVPLTSEYTSTVEFNRYTNSAIEDNTGDSLVDLVSSIINNLDENTIRDIIMRCTAYQLGQIMTHDRVLNKVMMMCTEGKIAVFHVLTAFRHTPRVDNYRTAVIWLAKEFMNDDNEGKFLDLVRKISPWYCTLCTIKFATKGRLMMMLEKYTDCHNLLMFVTEDSERFETVARVMVSLSVYNDDYKKLYEDVIMSRQEGSKTRSVLSNLVRVFGLSIGEFVSEHPPTSDVARKVALLYPEEV